MHFSQLRQYVKTNTHIYFTYEGFASNFQFRGKLKMSHIDNLYIWSVIFLFHACLETLSPNYDVALTQRHCFVILLSGLGGNSNRLLVAYSPSLFIHINFLTNRFFKTRVANTSLFFKLHYECHSVILLGLRSHLFLTCCRQSTLLISRELPFFFYPWTKFTHLRPVDCKWSPTFSRVNNARYLQDRRFANTSVTYRRGKLCHFN